MFLHRKDDHDLGLTLSLGGGGPPSSSKATTTTTITTSGATPFKFNMMMDYSSTSHIGLLQKLPWNTSTNSFPTSLPSDGTLLRGIDVNRAAVRVDEGEEEEAGVSSPNSTVSTVSGGKRSRTETYHHSVTTTTVGPTAGDEINEIERTLSSRGMTMSDEEEDDGSENSRKKLRLTKDQSALLEHSFKEHNTLNPKQKLALAKRLGLRPRQVEVWFQNRRARTKLKQTEVDCEFLKRCCEQLTEENRRLHKEVAELRTLKLSPQFYMQMTPPTTLTMCPSCERVGVPPSGSGQPGPARNRVASPWAAGPVPVPGPAL